MKKALALLLAALMLSGTVATGLAAADAAESETLDYVQGDINGDGDVNISDAVLLFRSTMAPDLYPVSYAGDMDFTLDENVDIYDAIRLFQYSMLPEEYPLFLTYNVTKDGEATSHIVLFDGADIVENTAAEELVYHIQLQSGAEVPVTNTIGEDSLPIIIATPDSYPELETLFPEDLAWLRTLTEETADGTRNWGDDGFAIRSLDGKIYIFGATAKGALNGTYDFIEENMDIIWVRAIEDHSVIYDENPTITVTKTNYREKSPFQIRGWHLSARSNQHNMIDLFARNKLNSQSGVADEAKGIGVFSGSHNVKSLVYNSPIYDPECTEYWNTDGFGNPLTYEDSMQVNFWSDKVVEAIVASIVAYVKEGASIPLMAPGTHGIFVGMEDVSTGYQIPQSREPFEYAPGQFVDPAKNKTLFLTTVWFSFINKIAKRVAEECPGTNIVTFAYNFSLKAPLCELEDNVIVMYAPLSEDLTASLFDANNKENKAIYKTMEGWKDVTSNFFLYNYYGCFAVADRYSRPIWDNIQQHMQYYAESGFLGVQPEGVSSDDSNMYWFEQKDDGTHVAGGTTDIPNSAAWDMNGMIYWIYAKLTWNPYEDVDALIVEFCDKYYGGASEYMKEYYRLIKQGWDEGKETITTIYDWFTSFAFHVDHFILNPAFEEPIYEMILETLNKAWDAANDVEKERILHIKKTMEESVQTYLNSK